MTALTKRGRREQSKDRNPPPSSPQNRNEPSVNQGKTQSLKTGERTIGKIFPKRTMLLRMHVGEAKSGDDVFALSTSVNTGQPIVQHEGTGKWFTLEWKDIIQLAVDAGIEKEES